MRDNRRDFFHRLHGVHQPRTKYSGSDFLDYALMVALSALTIGLSYGVAHALFGIGVALCAFALVAFIVRHGVELKVPVFLTRPRDVVHMVAYKFRNLTPIYFGALGLLLLENVLIAATPSLPHRVELMRTIAFYLFYAHFIAITAYRTAILVDHLAKKEPTMGARTFGTCPKRPWLRQAVMRCARRLHAARRNARRRGRRAWA